MPSLGDQMQVNDVPNPDVPSPNIAPAVAFNAVPVVPDVTPTVASNVMPNVVPGVTPTVAFNAVPVVPDVAPTVASNNVPVVPNVMPNVVPGVTPNVDTSAVSVVPDVVPTVASNIVPVVSNVMPNVVPGVTPNVDTSAVPNAVPNDATNLYQATPVETDLIFVSGTTRVMLTAQQPVMRSVIHDAFERVRVYLLFNNAFPDASIVLSMTKAALVTAAEAHERASKIYRRLLDDAEYATSMIHLVSYYTFM